MEIEFKDESEPIMGQKRIGVGNPAVLLFAFSLGVVSIRYIPTIWQTWVFAGMAACSLVVSWKLHGIRWVAAFCLGFCWAGWTAADVMQRDVPADLEKKDLIANGRIVSLVRPIGRGATFTFKIDSLYQGKRLLASPGLVRLTSYSPELGPEPGDRWRFVVRLKRAHGLQNPGASFNYETWLFQQRIRASGYIVKGQAEKLGVEPGVYHKARRRIANLRQGFAEFISTRFGPSSQAGIISALSVGVRHQMSDLQWTILQNTGTIHLVAISGLHIGFVAAMAGLLGRLFWCRVPFLCRWVPASSAAVVVGFLSGFGYGVLAGFTVPTRRAVCMLALVGLVLLLRRKGKPVELLVLVLGLILLLDPLAPLSSSFWLSFSAVSVLVMVASGSNSPANISSAWCARVLTAISIWVRLQWWLLIAMMPILLIAFHQVSLIAPMANLIAIPVIGMLVVPISLVAFLAYCTGLMEISQMLLEVNLYLIDSVWIYLNWLASISGAIWQQGQPPWWTIVAAIFGILCLSRRALLPVRVVAIFCLLPMFVVRTEAPLFGEFSYTLLDVGQGLGSVIKTRHHVLVFDAGAAYPGGFNLGKVVMTPYLRLINTRQIDKLIISHGDNDHIGGASAIATGFAVRSSLTSATDSPWALPGSSSCHRGQRWTWDGVIFEVLWPELTLLYSGNDSSCVLKVSSHYGSVLLTGDIESAAERSLVNLYGDTILDVDVLQVPHHGSNTSSSVSFIDSVSPVLALVSAGNLNRYRHPHPDVLARYRNRGTLLANTASEGAITVEFKSAGKKISGQRATLPRFWQKPGQLDFVRINQLINSPTKSPGETKKPGA